DGKEVVETIPTPNVEIIHHVISGVETGKIADKYGVKCSEIQEWNMLKVTYIKISQHLMIYSNKKPATNSQKPATNNQQSEMILYTVKSGDNLWDIAKNYPGVSAEDIMELNNIDENIKIGQVLKIKKK